MEKGDEKDTIPAGPMIDRLEEWGINQAEFAKRINVSPQRITNWKSRGIPRAELYTVARGLRMTVEQYLEETEPKRKKAVGKTVRTDAGSALPVPIFDVQGAMGAGRAVAQEVVVGGLNLSREWVRAQLPGVTAHSNLAIISAFGDSMAPTFQDGDILLIDRGVVEVRLDAVYVIGRGEDLFVKRVQRRLAGELVIRSDNPLFEPETISGEGIARVRILGRVVWAWNGRRL